MRRGWDLEFFSNKRLILDGFEKALRPDGRTDGRTNGRTDGRMDGQTDGWTDRPSCRGASKHLKILFNQQDRLVQAIRYTLYMQWILPYRPENQKKINGISMGRQTDRPTGRKMNKVL